MRLGVWKQMFRSTQNTPTRKPWFICLCVLGLLLSGSSGCSYSKSRRAQAIARGNHLFELHCSGCHGRRRLDIGKVPPDLHGIFDSKFLPSGRSATDDVVRSTILTGRSGIMPPFEGNLSDESIEDIILYLHTLKVPPKTPSPNTDTGTVAH
jgi:mono/diheme cytochrome c family protein